jgi:hypothetical protein
MSVFWGNLSKSIIHCVLNRISYSNLSYILLVQIDSTRRSTTGVTVSVTGNSKMKPDNLTISSATSWQNTAAGISGHFSTTLTEVFPCFFSVVRQTPGYNLQRRGTARTSHFFYCYVMFRSLFSVYCLCVNAYCTAATGCQPNVCCTAATRCQPNVYFTAATGCQPYCG